MHVPMHQSAISPTPHMPEPIPGTYLQAQSQRPSLPESLEGDIAGLIVGQLQDLTIAVHDQAEAQ